MINKLKNIVPQSLKNYIHKVQAFWGNVIYGFPGESLKIIGVTGTDGKTSTSTMIYELLRTEGIHVGLITSVSAKIGKKELDTGFHVTTPDPWIIPKYLRMMVDSNIKWVVLEITSHALDQNRGAYISLEKAVFTNITKEHLDYHKTWLNLANTKVKLIDMLREGGDVTYSVDKKGARVIERKIRDSKKVILTNKFSEEKAKKIQIGREGIQFKYSIKGKDVDIYIPILGEYNISNACSAIEATKHLVSTKTIVNGFKNFKGITGRMQLVRKKKPCMVIVDFAHTTNALKNALQTVNSLKQKGRVIVVFGCAGLRDKYKRKKMGAISVKMADLVIITAEDPRIEDLSKINDSIIIGAVKKKGKLLKRFPSRKAYKKTKLTTMKKKIEIVMKSGATPIVVFDQPSIKSREDAIEFAIKSANPEDIVLITGKGHEKSLCFGNIEYPWSDFDAVKRAVKSKYKKKNDDKDLKSGKRKTSK